MEKHGSIKTKESEIRDKRLSTALFENLSSQENLALSSLHYAHRKHTSIKSRYLSGLQLTHFIPRCQFFTPCSFHPSRSYPKYSTRKNRNIMGKVLLFLLFSFLFIGIQSLCAQKLWSEVSMDKSSVYVGEPIQVKISVYTSTWFTSGIDLGNLSIEGAFTVFFRSTSISTKKYDKDCPGVQLIYNIFPYSKKDISFPPLDIAVESPEEGGYKGKRQIVKSNGIRIKVHPIPAAYDINTWLVTTGLSVTDNWQGDLKNVKVGDVIVRHIKRTAQGTVAELIPPMIWDSIPEVSLYQARNEVTNNRSKTAISATQTETLRYLLEKEGEITIPEVVFTWYNPVQKKAFKRTLNSITINVQANPNLGILTSIRDSLNIMREESQSASGEKVPFLFFGLPPEQFAAILIALFILLYLLFHIGKQVYKYAKEKHKKYLKSEAFYFNQFIKTASSNNYRVTLNALYRWIDELHLQEASLQYFVENYGSRELLKESEFLQKGSSVNINNKEWKSARLNYKTKKSSQRNLTSYKWINP